MSFYLNVMCIFFPECLKRVLRSYRGNSSNIFRSRSAWITRGYWRAILIKASIVSGFLPVSFAAGTSEIMQISARSLLDISESWYWEASQIITQLSPDLLRTEGMQNVTGRYLYYCGSSTVVDTRLYSITRDNLSAVAIRVVRPLSEHVLYFLYCLVSMIPSL